ncbi:hypothetical protein KFL_002680080 [Klebsormidium nitens]|uniref:Uncharacterized protein n=1 Tax=Klebsormidium nitens TaxID=105231 RepID=A0A1Y1I7Y8_KLENI|nr:hypothetical protein KFL_002680080 [Klebsormidium nitens]|eukprot:GAQ86062.1 hypothetical protein KFL_002680080 [Klebsormidium nitens]
MAGGERERKGKRKESRFSDRPRPKKTKAELAALADKRAGVYLKETPGSAFVFCPVDGKKLEGALKKCPRCLVQYAKANLTQGGPSKWACLYDARDIAAFWRRKIFWRLAATNHSGVLWSTQPFVPLPAFEAVFSDDWNELAVKTATVETHVKILETTRAVQEFCGFGTVNEKRGHGACKLLASGEVLVVVPPVEVTHTYSKAAGARVHFVYGWVQMTITGNISKAEDMVEPAQGWQFVERWIRDQVWDMLTDLEMGVSEAMVAASEAILLSEYGSQEECDAARVERSMVVEHYVMPRPASGPQVERRRKQAAEMHAGGLDDGFFSLPAAEEDQPEAAMPLPLALPPRPLPPLAPPLAPLPLPAVANPVL